MSELERFQTYIASARGSGKTTAMINAANAYAKEHPEEYVLVVAANGVEKRRLRRLTTEDNIHVTVPSEQGREQGSYHVTFWDHYAAEQSLAIHLKIYDERMAGMLRSPWFNMDGTDNNDYDDWDE